MAFLDQIRAAVAAGRRETNSVDPLYEALARVSGSITRFGEERVSTQQILEALGIPEQQRIQTARKIAPIMRSLGWSPKPIGPSQRRERGYVRSREEQRPDL